MEKVIKYYLQEAAQRVQTARESLDSAMSALNQIEDLDAAETPERSVLFTTIVFCNILHIFV